MSYVSNTPTFEELLANRRLKRDPETGRLFPEDIPWEVCQCGYLPREDRDYCTMHGTNAKRPPEPEPQQQPKRISVARTRLLHDISSGNSRLDRIEEIVNQGIVEGDFTVRQCNIMRWALRTCRKVAEEIRIREEELL